MISCDGDPRKVNLMQAIYHSVGTDQLGYMDGMDPDTKEIVPLLVGIDREEDGKLNLYPIAKIFLSPDELKNYISPSEYSLPTDANGELISADIGKAEE